MKNFSLDNFFAAFKSLRARGTASFDGAECGSRSKKCCDTRQDYGRRYDCMDEEVRFDMPESGCSKRSGRSKATQKQGCGCGNQEQYNWQPQEESCEAFSCRHTEHEVIRQDDCCCEEPAPQQQCQPQKPAKRRSEQVNVNNGIIDGQGNDVYGMGNRGIIDTDGDDIYARNYTVNTFNTTNNFYRKTVIEPTVAPTQEPTQEPTPPYTESPEVEINLLPLRNLLNVMEGVAGGQRDGVLSDFEMDKSMKHPNIADMDGDKKNISSEELAIFNRIKVFNEDKDLIRDVIAGDYSNISESTLLDLQDLSDTIQELTKKRE